MAFALSTAAVLQISEGLATNPMFGGVVLRTPHKSLFLLPSLITLSSIFCGFLAVVIALNATGAEGMHRAALLIGLAMILDGFDGRVARMTHTESEFGIQLDSLADVLSFGLAPGVIIYQFGLQSLGFVGAFASFCFIACGAVRLARFNVQATQGEGASAHFVGLPIPAAAAMASSLVLVLSGLGYAHAPEALIIPMALMMVVLGGLMVSTIRYKTFKKVRVIRHEQVLVVGVLGFFAVVSTLWSAAGALALCLLVYVTLGLFGAALSVKNRSRAGIHGYEEEDEESVDLFG